MGSSNSTPSTPNPLGYQKVKGIQLPGQSGKTRKMEEKLKDFMLQARKNNGEDDLNIMLTSNNKILVEQTSGRINNDLGPESEKDDSSLNSDESIEDPPSDIILVNGAGEWTSSQNMEVNDMYADIIDDKIGMFVCCSNGARIKKTAALIKKLQESRHFKKKINIWVDEAHKTIRILKKYLDILSYSKVHSIILVTASWDPIDKLYKIPRFTYEVTHPEVYRSLRECEWKIVEPLISDTESTDEIAVYDLSCTAPGYIAQILQSQGLREKIEKPGSCWLIPGNSRTLTHDVIADDLIQRGWNGLKLNGKEKSLTIHVDKLVIDYTEYNSKKQEPKDVLSNLFKEFPRLKSAPFFVTGLNCIKEGITFQGEGFMFDGAIIPSMSNASDAYQLACRLAGNLKGLENYKTHSSPLIITTSRMQKKIQRQENINIFLPRILYEEGRDIPTEMDKNRAARGDVKHDPKRYGYRVFKSFDIFSNYIKEIKKKKSKFTKQPNGKGLYKGKHTCSVQSSLGAKEQPRYLTEVIDKIALAYGGTGSRVGFPCYLDIAKAPEGLVWVVVISESTDKDLIITADSKFPNEYDELIKFAKEYR